jgi:arylsulfatase A-like enzyme
VKAAAPLRQRLPGDNKPPYLGPGGIVTYRNMTALDEDYLYGMAAVYLGRIAYADFLPGQLLDGLAASPLASATVLISHSDHGDFQLDYASPEKWPGA